MVFSLKPQPIPDDFTWKSKYFHLTYKGHLPAQEILQTVSRATSVYLVGYSIVHEDTSEYDAEGYQLSAGYEHTHVALIFATPLNLKGSRKFDVFVHNNPHDPFDYEQIHPHVQPKVTLVQMEQLFTQYHAGRKYDITTGKMSYKEPIMHVYHLPPLFDFHRAIMEEVVTAPTLFEACISGQVRPRSVTDIKALRAEEKQTKRFKHMFPASSFTLTAPADWHVLHIHGGSGFGKTKWSLAQFKNPLLVKPFDSIGCLESIEKRFDPDQHDGLVLDEANLKFLSRQQVIALLDPDEDCTLDVRFKSFTLPASLKKIIVSNEAPGELYPFDPHGAISRRLKTLHVTEPTFRTAPVTPAMQQLPAGSPATGGTTPVIWLASRPAQ